MLSLSAQDVLAIWERGQGQSSLERGLAILGCALPDASWEDLAGLPIGERDRLLLKLRERSFGPRLNAYAVCPQCREKLEYNLKTPDFAGHFAERCESAPVSREVAFGEYRICLRPPSSADLIAAEEAEAFESSRMVLLERCIVQAFRKEAPFAPAELPDEIIGALGDCLAAADPGGENLVQLECSTCHHMWSLVFDIASFMYEEISVLARRILEDIHVLASAYGWGENEILALPAARRQVYLEMAR